MIEPTDREALLVAKLKKLGFGGIARVTLMPLIFDYGNEREAAALERAATRMDGLSDVCAAEIRSLSPLPDYAEQLRLEGALAEAKRGYDDLIRGPLECVCRDFAHVRELEARLREIVEKSKAREAK